MAKAQPYSMQAWRLFPRAERHYAELKAVLFGESHKTGEDIYAPDHPDFVTGDTKEMPVSNEGILNR